MTAHVKEGYYYLHTNGQLIWKAPAVVNPLGADDYFDSDFVVKYWYVKTMEDNNEMLIEVSKLRQKMKEEAGKDNEIKYD